MQIALVDKTARGQAFQDFLAFAAKACDAQVIECAAAWGIDPTPVAFYAGEEGLPQANCRIMALVDDIDAPGALGYHDDAAGIVYGRVLAQDQNGTSTTLSHECLEELVDPTCDKWRPMGGGRSTALEVCDAVEADSYGVTVEIMGEQRSILLSNYLLPKWFDPAATGNFDRMGTLSAPFAMDDGGYMIVRDALGNEGNVFARARLRAPSTKAKLSIATKLGNAETRLARRLRAA